MYRRSSFTSDENAARDFLENLPPVPDDSQAPRKPSQQPPTQPDVKVDYPVGRSANDDAPEYPPPPPYTPPPLGQKPRPFLRGTGSKLVDALVAALGWLLFGVPLFVVVALLFRGLSGAAGRLFARPTPTPAPTAAPEQVDGPYTADDVRRMLGDVPYAPVPTTTPEQIDGAYTADDVRQMLGDAPYAPAAPSPTATPSGPWGDKYTTHEAIGSQTRTVYWTPDGKSYHFNRDCPSLSRSTVVRSGPLSEAMENGHSDPCNNCVL